MSTPDLAAAYLTNIVQTFKRYKALGEAAIGQVPTDASLNATLDPESNSIAVIVKHVAGNLGSRFRDFLTTDGEKPDRRRDGEFEIPRLVARDEILTWWKDGWTTALGAIEALTSADLGRTVLIGGESFLVIEALNRSVAHTAYHVGQIVYVARHLAGPTWASLSIPKGRSAEFARGDFKGKGLAGRNDP